MNISEIPVGGQITVIASKDKKSVELKTVAKTNFSGGLLVERITNKRNQPISFAVANLQIQIVYINKNRQPVIWDGVKIKHITIEGTSYHRIIQTTPGSESERRRSPRIFIGEDATVRIGLSTKAFNVKIKDLSYSGISFISDENVNYDDSLLHVTFKNGSNTINVATSINRKAPIKNKSSYVYGGRIADPANNPDLQAYLLRRKNQ